MKMKRRRSLQHFASSGRRRSWSGGHIAARAGAAYVLTQALLPALMRARHVLFLNSSAWLRHRPKLSGYSGSQHALRVMADALRAEANEHGAGVTSLYLGRTLARRIARLFAEE